MTCRKNDAGRCRVSARNRVSLLSIILVGSFTFTTGTCSQTGNTGGSKNAPSAGHTTGSPDDEVWKKIEFNGEMLFVRTNGFFYRKPSYPYYGFHTYIGSNLPESTVVGAPESVITDIEGNCQTRHYHVLGSLYYQGKNRSGIPMQSTPAEDFERKLVPGSVLEKAFDMLCKLAETP